MGHSLTRTNLTINQNFVFQDGGQAANKMLTSDLKGKVSWRYPSDFMITDPLEHYIGELFGGGIVVSVWKEAGVEKLLIASVKDYSESISAGSPAIPRIEKSTWQWSSANVTGNYSRSRSFGLANSNANILIDPNATAISKCLNYTNENLNLGVYNDWYLPAPNEVLTMLNSTSILNRVLYQFAVDNSYRLVPESGYRTVNSGGFSYQEPYLNMSQINLIMETSYNDFQLGRGGYWTSTLDSSNTTNSAIYVSNCIDVPNTWYQPGNLLVGFGKTNNLTVRPFRIHTVYDYVNNY